MKRSLQLALNVAKTSAAANPNRLRALSRVRAQQSAWAALDGAATLVASKESAVKGLATLFSRDRRPGDCFLFYGEVGAGKSTFSRAYIRSIADDPFLQVPSPTFLLKHSYELEESPVVNHFDLYRLGEAADWSRLQLHDSFEQDVSLVEWAERLRGPLPGSYMGVHLNILSQVPTWAAEAEAKAQRVHSLAEPEYAMAAQHGGAAGAAGYGEEEEDEGEDDAGYLFVDRRWRVLRLHPMGPHWQQRLEDVKQVVRHGGVPGLLLVEGEAETSLLQPQRLAREQHRPH